MVAAPERAVHGAATFLGKVASHARPAINARPTRLPQQVTLPKKMRFGRILVRMCAYDPYVGHALRCATAGPRWPDGKWELDDVLEVCDPARESEPSPAMSANHPRLRMTLASAKTKPVEGRSQARVRSWGVGQLPAQRSNLRHLLKHSPDLTRELREHSSWCGYRAWRGDDGLRPRIRATMRWPRRRE
jgi:hypothetical protein